MTQQPRNPSAAIVIIGAEVLSAKVRDANGPYLLERLRAQGIDVIELRVIGDSIEVIAETARALIPSRATTMLQTPTAKADILLRLAGFSRFFFAKALIATYILFLNLLRGFGNRLHENGDRELGHLKKRYY